MGMVDGKGMTERKSCLATPPYDNLKLGYRVMIILDHHGIVRLLPIDPYLGNL